MALFRNKSRNPTKNDKSLYDWAMNLTEDGRARKRIYEAQCYENIAAYCGDLWAEYDITLQQLVEPAKPDHRVRLPVNLVQPTVRTEYAKLLKNRPIIDCVSRSDVRSDLNSARVGDSVLNHYVEKDLHFPRVRRQMLQWVLICGLGGIFVDHDPSALGDQEVLIAPDGSPVTDPQMIGAIQRHYRDKKKAPKTQPMPLGELRNVACSPFMLIWDFSKIDFNQAWWCIVSEVFDVDEVYRRWRVEVEGNKEDKPGVLDRRAFQQWDITDRPVVEWSRGDTQKLVTVHRLFVRPGHRYFPNGTEIVYTDTELIDHTNFPWKHGMLPVGVCGHIPAPWTQHTTSVVPHIKPLALEVSKTTSQLIENRNLMGNPPWIEFSEMAVQGEIVNKPGLRLTVNYMPNVPEPHPIEMPEISQYIKDLIPMMKENILEISGQSEVSQGKVPAGARAGVTIAYLQEEDDTKLGPTVLEYEECMERAAWLQLQVMGQEYDIPRTVRIYKPFSEPEVFDFIGTMLTGIAGVQVQAGSALPRSKAAKQQFILDLWDRQIETDPRKVMHMLELNEGEPDDWTRDISEQERENREMQLGQEVQVEEWQNHQAHAYQCANFMKSPEWDMLDDRVKEIFRAHWRDHNRYMDQQAQKQMVQQALAGQSGGGPGQPPQNTGGGANGINATPQGPFAPQSPANGGTSAALPPGQTNGSVQDYQPQ